MPWLCQKGVTNAPAEFTTQIMFSHFISGLRQDIKTQIHIQNPGDFAEALQTAIRIEKAFKDTTQNVNCFEASASAATRAHEADKNAFITGVEALTNRILFGKTSRGFSIKKGNLKQTQISLSILQQRGSLHRRLQKEALL
ncbi:hypothetical protein JTE90_018471 [Oedothorax gibbosus]|uniref:Uncharacterized protein n=1 Tax=Oedothorax gibbosus TaxID=931172 RepID=A0AAV6UEV9_9ARAC|nr:hypothetical protein JTE90_018471 [Oedothorax gibbosus]